MFDHILIYNVMQDNHLKIHLIYHHVLKKLNLFFSINDNKIIFIFFLIVIEYVIKIFDYQFI